jgi:hypothetical protein
MDCAKVRKHLSDYVDGLLSGRLKKSVDAHIQRCPGCREELTALKALRRKMGGLHRMSAPPDFLDRVHRRLEREGAQARKKRRRVFFLPAGVPVGIAALATAAVALLFVLNVILPRMEERPRSVDVTASRERVPSAVEERPAPDGEPEAAESEEKAEPAGGRVPEQAKVGIGDRAPKAQRTEDRIPETRGEFTAMRALDEGETAPAPADIELVLYLQPEGSEKPHALPAERVYEGDTERDKKRDKYSDVTASVLLFIENLARDFGGDILSMDYGERADIPRSVTAEIPAGVIDEFAEALTRAGEIERAGDIQDMTGWTGLVSVRILLNSQTEE